MGTHAIFKVSDSDGTHHVFKHSDGYPSEAACTLAITLQYFAWALPRFEADEFSAAIAAAIKAEYLLKELELRRKGEKKTADDLQHVYNAPERAGGAGRLMTAEMSDEWDAEYTYTIEQVGRKVMISVNGSDKMEISAFIKQNDRKS